MDETAEPITIEDIEVHLSCITVSMGDVVEYVDEWVDTFAPVVPDELNKIIADNFEKVIDHCQQMLVALRNRGSALSEDDFKKLLGD